MLPTCNFIQEEEIAYSTSGCKLIEIANSTVRCECSHLTTFAILMVCSRNHNFLPRELAQGIPNIDLFLFRKRVLMNSFLTMKKLTVLLFLRSSHTVVSQFPSVDYFSQYSLTFSLRMQ